MEPKKYIEVDAFINKLAYALYVTIEELRGNEFYEGKIKAYKECLAELKRFHPADVRENVHGEWLFVKDRLWVGETGVECSKCGSGFPFASFFEPDEFDYCPNCGAYMLTEEDIKRRKRHEHKVPDKWIVRNYD